MFNDREKGFKVRRIAMNNTQNERVEVKIVRLLKTSPEFAYQAWTDPEMLRHWFMTTSRSNKTIESDVTEGGHYLIIDQRQGKKNTCRRYLSNINSRRTPLFNDSNA